MRWAHRGARQPNQYYPSRQPAAVGKAPGDFAGAAATLSKPLLASLSRFVCSCQFRAMEVNRSLFVLKNDWQPNGGG